MMRVVVGTLAVAAFEQLERLFLGRRPVYAASKMVRRMRGAHRRSAIDTLAGATLRTAYAYALSRPRGRPALWTIATTTAELIALPALRLTPPLSRWRRAELCLLPLHAGAFFAALSAWDRAQRGRSR